MSLCTDDIKNTARLARLCPNEERACDYANDIGKILTMMDVLASVDTDGILPLTNVHDAAQPLRTDVADGNIDRDKLQSIAPKVADGLYLVPKVIE